jgi:hypothetical protein
MSEGGLVRGMLSAMIADRTSSSQRTRDLSNRTDLARLSGTADPPVYAIVALTSKNTLREPNCPRRIDKYADELPTPTCSL